MRALLFLSLAACTASPLSSSSSSSSSELVENIQSIQKRPDGRFDVTCDNGRTEVVTADQIRNDDVCGGAPASGIATYACNSSANLEISFVGGDGRESRGTVPIGTFGRCNEAAATLGETRSEISRPVILGACDSSANLQRFGLHPVTGVKKLAATQVGTFSRCDAAAEATNAPVPAATGDAAMADYACNASANLELVGFDRNGAETRRTVSIGTFSRCDASAATLRQKRRDIRRTMLLGVCDSSANLQRFSATPAAGLSALATTQIGTFSGCDQQAATINQ